MPLKVGNNLVLFDVAELAKMFNVTPLTVKAYIRKGRLKGQKMGKKWFVSETSLSEFFNTAPGIKIKPKRQ